jgi:hypothetical protein
MTMIRYTLTLCALCAVALVATAPAVAQIDDRAGTAAMEELLVPVTPRATSLGSALTSGLTSLQGVEALQSNPASVMSNTSTNAMFSRMNYIADIGVNYFGVAQRFGSNNIALTVTSWDFGDISLTDELLQADPDPNVTYDASSFVVGLTLARQFTDRIAAGFSVKGLNRTIAESSAPGVAFDAGMNYVIGESGLQFGVSLKNFGTKSTFSGDDLDQTVTVEGPEGPITNRVNLNVKEDELPSQLNFGAAYTRQFAQDVNATVIANFRSNAYDLDQYTAGLELGYQNLFYVRGGLSMTAEADLDAWEDWSLGAGINVPFASSSSIAVDYAFRPSTLFENVNMFSLSFTL